MHIYCTHVECVTRHSEDVSVHWILSSPVWPEITQTWILYMRSDFGHSLVGTGLCLYEVSEGLDVGHSCSLEVAEGCGFFVTAFQAALF